MKQVSSRRISSGEFSITSAAGSMEFELPVALLGYAAVIGNIRSDQDVSIYCLQGKVGDRWLSGKNSAVDVTGSSVNDAADDGTGEPFAFQVTDADARLVVLNESGNDATILLSYNLVGLI